ncbi:MAG TPA: hypothetical protein VK933_03530 [Longimicrobiales bacterium]|nr:hypothetical protein [Longimicrobiales bacterium]
MAQPPAEATELARRLVTHEARSSVDPAAWADAVESVCCRLKDHLAGLLGSGGVVALMGRALNLAKREQPMLAEVKLGAEPSACFTGLVEALAAGTAEDAAAAGSSLVAHLLGLLILLLGRELGTQPIRQLWPHVASSVREIDA